MISHKKKLVETAVMRKERLALAKSTATKVKPNAKAYTRKKPEKECRR